MGFGHRVYKNFDPRATIIKTHLRQTAVEAENPRSDFRHRPGTGSRRAVAIDYFIERKLYPNVDFYCGVIYRAMGIPVQHVHRALRDRPPAGLDRPLDGNAPHPGKKICRPRQVYTGSLKRDYTPLGKRG